MLRRIQEFTYPKKFKYDAVTQRWRLDSDDIAIANYVTDAILFPNKQLLWLDHHMIRYLA